MTLASAIRLHEAGGPNVMKLETISVGNPQGGEVRVRHTAIGLNYIDVYHRTGLYPLDFPTGLGLEAAGVVTAVGDGVTSLKIGDRIAYGTGPIGAYATEAIVPAGRVAPLPDSISDEQGAAMMLQGLTAHYLLKTTYKIQQGNTLLIHAAAGGVGLLVCQWAKHLGARVIGTVGSKEKADLAKKHGCDHTILYRDTDFVDQVKEITDGAGVNVVYDSIGKDTLTRSLDCLIPRGMLVSFGNASGPPDPIDVGTLGAKGSLFLTRPSLFHYFAKDDELIKGSKELMDVVKDKIVRIEINQRYPLSEAAQAHRDLEARKTTGSTILVP